MDRELHPAVGALLRVAPLAIPEALDAILRLAIPQAELDTPWRLSMFLAAWDGRTCGYSRLREPLTEVRLRRIERTRQCYGNPPGGAGLYPARGIAMLRGRRAYQAFGHWMGVPLEKNPERLEEPEYAVWSGIWVWRTHLCNSISAHPARIEIATMGRIDKNILADYHECAIIIENKYPNLFEGDHAIR